MIFKANQPIALIYLILVLIPLNLNSMEHYFYNKTIKYGTEAQFNPIHISINGTFDILRNGWVPRKVQDIDFNNGFDLLNESLTNYSEIIDKYNSYSEDNFYQDQFFPVNLNEKRGAWFPNYQSHLLGEGMVSRKLAEWYDANNYPFPYALGIATTFAFQYGNEVLELSPFKNTSVDPIADIYYFNTAGYILFAIDPVARFFSETVKMNCWYPQPMLSPLDGTLSNAGEQYIIKSPLPKTDQLKAFYSWGIDGTFGLSYQAKNDKTYSLGIGKKAFRLKQSLVNNNIIYPELEPHFAFFIDKNESLLFSLSQTGIKKVNLIMNIYPGFINDKVGIYGAYNDFTQLELGFSYIGLPIGLQF